MNSVYKRYFVITLIVLVFTCGIMVNNGLKLFGEIDAVNAYAAENGSVADFEFNRLGCYISSSGEMEEDLYYPDFQYGRDSLPQSSGTWTVAAAIMIMLFYFYERSPLTADFCAVLPVKSRSRFLVKAGCVALVALALMIVEIWVVQGFNQRVAACNETYRILGVTEDTVTAVTLYPLTEVRLLFQKLLFGATLLLLSEMTGKVYLPVCIWVLSVFALTGSLAGLYQYCILYFNYDIFSILDGVTPVLRDGYVTEYIFTGVLIALTLAGTLWALFLSGRGDMSRKGRVFRFAWAQWLALACITVCAVFCAFEIIWLSELSYILSAGMSLAAMLIAGVIAFFVARRVIIWLGR